MTESISYPGLITALFLPWILGGIWVRYFIAGASQWNWPIVLGQGYLAGIFTTTLLIRVWDLSGIGFSFTVMSALLIALCALGLFLQRRGIERMEARAALPEIGWQKAVVITLLALIAWRYFSILQEVIVRPLYPMDAWMNWSPKAVTWFFNDALVNYVSPQQWLAHAPADGVVHTLGNWGAWKYPPTVPLVQLWTMLGAQTHDHSLLFLPWWLLPISLGLALYGHLRLSGCPVLLATIACYLLLSLPYLNVHTALAGYADIWMASAFSLALFALHQWQSDGRRSFALLSLFLAFACTQIKMPGIVLGLIIFGVFIRDKLNLSGKLELIGCAVILGLVVGLLALGIDLTIPGLGRIYIGDGELEIAVFGQFSYEFHNVSSAFLQSFFHTINWNIFWPLCLLALIVRGRNGGLGQRPSNILLACIAAMAFLIFVFYFTNHYNAALNMITLNRALLYLIPSLLFYAFIYATPPLKSSPE